MKLEVTEQPSDQPVGTITAQDPPAETIVAVGSTINVTVASGVEQVPMPDLRNKTEAQAVTGDRRRPASSPAPRQRRSIRSSRSVSS